MAKKQEKQSGPDKYGHTKPTKGAVKSGKASPRGRNRGRGR